MRIKIMIFALCVAYGAPHAARADNPLPGNFVGGNLTSFSEYPGSVNNNQYNQMMNPDRGSAAGGGATADFGNCNALIQRCAAPKCAGCGDMSIAVPIVAGCVQTTSECRKHGDALTQAIAAQIVSANQAKANAAAQQQAAAQAAAAQAQSAQQIQAVQDQMTQMQQQMAAQQAESAAQMQQALAAQQQAAEAAMAQQAAQLAQQQQPAAAIAAAPATQQQVDMGVSADAIARQQIVGQVMSALDGVDSSMQSLKKTMQNVLDYAGCDYNANSCAGPKRVAAFRRKAQDFFEPYDSVLDSLESSLYTAMAAGVDVSDIYMMLTNSCNQWGKYLCQDKNADPFVYCRSGNYSASSGECISYKDKEHPNKVANPTCTFIEMYKSTDRDSVQQNWITATEGDETRIRMACMSDGVLNSGIFSRRSRKKSNDFDIDALEIVINQDEPRNGKAEDAKKYCCNENAADNSRIDIDMGKQMISTRKYDKIIGTISGGDMFSVKADCLDSENDVCYANPAYALCSTHAYNICEAGNDNLKNSETRQRMEETIALKSTVIAQQLKKQHDYLASMVKQIKTQMQKAVMATAAEAAGAARESSGSSGNSVAGADCVGKGRAEVISCVDRTLPALRSMSASDFRKSCGNVEVAMSGFFKSKEKPKIDCKKSGTAERNEVIAAITGALQNLRDKETEMSRMGGYRN